MEGALQRRHAAHGRGGSCRGGGRPASLVWAAASYSRTGAWASETGRSNLEVGSPDGGVLGPGMGAQSLALHFCAFPTPHSLLSACSVWRFLLNSGGPLLPKETR